MGGVVDNLEPGCGHQALHLPGAVEGQGDVFPAPDDQGGDIEPAQLLDLIFERLEEILAQDGEQRLQENSGCRGPWPNASWQKKRTDWFPGLCGQGGNRFYDSAGPDFK
jgi:hypothetical protein